MTIQRKRRGHIPTEKNRIVVHTMAGMGARPEKIAQKLKVSVHTLAKHYEDELTNGAEEANLMVAQSLFEIATDKKGPPAPRVQAAKFWLSCRAGWKETQTLEHTGADGGPIETADARTRLGELVDRARKTQDIARRLHGEGDPSKN